MSVVPSRAQSCGVGMLRAGDSSSPSCCPTQLCPIIHISQRCSTRSMEDVVDAESTHAKPFKRPQSWHQLPDLLPLSTELSREERRRHARNQRYTRAAKHISSYIRVYVHIIDDENFDALRKGEGTDELDVQQLVERGVVFPITLRRDRTVDDLARQIEAEYAFKESKKEIKSDVDGAVRIQKMIVVGQLLAGDVPLKYDGFVGDLLAMDDLVYAVNVFEEDCTPKPRSRTGASSKHTSMPNASLPAQEEPDLREDGDNEEEEESNDEAELEDVPGELFSKRAPALTISTQGLPLTDGLESAPLQSASSSIAPFRMRRKRSTATTPNTKLGPALESQRLLEDRFQDCLANKFSLALFQDFCAREYTLENLLFFLDVEVFRHTCAEYAATQIQHLLSSEDATLSEYEDRPLVDPEVYANHVIDMYITTDSILQVNVDEDVREEVEAGRYRVKLEMFDEAQEAVYTLMKRHSFVQFERSSFGKQLKYLKEQGNINVPLAEIFPPSRGDFTTMGTHHRANRSKTSIEFGDDEERSERDHLLARTLSRFRPHGVDAFLVSGSDTDAANSTHDVHVTTVARDYANKRRSMLTPAQQRRREKTTTDGKLAKLFRLGTKTGKPSKGGFITKDELEFIEKIKEVQSASMPKMQGGDMAIDEDVNSTETGLGLKSPTDRADKLSKFFGKKLVSADGRDATEDYNIEELKSPRRSSLDSRSPKDAFTGKPNFFNRVGGTLRMRSRSNSDTSANPQSSTMSSSPPVRSTGGELLTRVMEAEEGSAHTDEDLARALVAEESKITPDMRRRLKKRHQKLKGMLGTSMTEDMVFDALVKPVLNVNNGDEVISSEEEDEEDEEDEEKEQRRLRKQAQKAGKVAPPLLGGNRLSVDSTVTLPGMEEDRIREQRRHKLEKLYDLLGRRMPLELVTEAKAAKRASLALARQNSLKQRNEDILVLSPVHEDAQDAYKRRPSSPDTLLGLEKSDSNGRPTTPTIQVDAASTTKSTSNHRANPFNKIKNMFVSNEDDDDNRGHSGDDRSIEGQGASVSVSGDDRSVTSAVSADEGGASGEQHKRKDSFGSKFLLKR